MSPIKLILIALAALLAVFAGCTSSMSPAETSGHQDSTETNNGRDSMEETQSHKAVPIPVPDIEQYLAKDGKSGWRVIMLGVDGLEWEALSDLIATGRLPNFQRLIVEGASGILKTDFADSPVTWTTIATGVRCEKHGLCPNRMEGMSFEQNLRSIKYPRLWEVLLKYGMQPYVADYYFIGTKFPPYGYGYPTEGEEVEDRVNPAIAWVLKNYKRPYDQLVFNGVAHTPYRDLGAQMRDTPVRLYSMKQYRGDLFISNFQNTDEVGHYEWGFYRMLLDKVEMSEATKKRAELGRDIFAAVYEDMDQRIGMIRKKFPEALIVICSDHGMRAMDPMTIYFIPQPRLFSMIGLPREINPNESVRIPGSETKVTLLNGKNRLQKRGDIHFVFTTPVLRFSGNGAEKEAKRSFAALSKFKLNDMPIFEMISDKEIGVNEHIIDNWQQLPSFGGDLMLFGTIAGSHTAGDDGVFIIHGPGVNKGVRLEGASVEDIAPTIYAYLGVPLAEDLDGETLAGAFNKGSLPGLEKSKVPSYGIAPNYKPGSRKHELTIEEKNRLRSLGYLR